MCPYLLISINELLISIIPFIDINKYGLNVKTAAHSVHNNSRTQIMKCISCVHVDIRYYAFANHCPSFPLVFLLCLSCVSLDLFLVSLCQGCGDARNFFTASSDSLFHPPLSLVFFFQSPSSPAFLTSLLTQSSHLSLASLVSSCPAHITLPLSSVVCYPPSFLRVCLYCGYPPVLVVVFLVFCNILLSLSQDFSIHPISSGSPTMQSSVPVSSHGAFILSHSTYVILSRTE